MGIVAFWLMALLGNLSYYAAAGSASALARLHRFAAPRMGARPRALARRGHRLGRRHGSSAMTAIVVLPALALLAWRHIGPASANAAPPPAASPSTAAVVAARRLPATGTDELKPTSQLSGSSSSTTNRTSSR